mmetsp:Transcript_23632/g.69917  ORF Transcript_23632/g.69917 Transcript_23632/m.69917 type:complete len:157 (-) Transcript_23632:401-871(-)|eukprot:CAMPEP_0113556782 /NCGR_PEP_ID=MMETSP0015_2-20120614/17435_1 /TAXON_ID=2838 /ORGANISM="Odontella" /LENGTH=156 /DNA_ID=CAMNT_0000458151 /DNA_START=380 /DNA_END=850 /DNA_ORIENTATION=+ /assembly_acc=CAM_ASM_000160
MDDVRAADEGERSDQITTATSDGKAKEEREGNGDGASRRDNTTIADAAAPTPAPPPSAALPSKAGNGKVKVHFVAVGSAPLMKKTKFAVASDQRFSFVISFLRRMLKRGNDSGDSLFLYVNSAFVPSPDELVGDLNECFSVRGELMVHYALQEAWG